MNGIVIEAICGHLGVPTREFPMIDFAEPNQCLFCNQAIGWPPTPADEQRKAWADLAK